jgi:hypothetical protein
LDEDAIAINVPFIVIERVTIGFGTAMQPKLIAQRFKPRLKWITRPLTRWIANQDNGSSK